MQTSRWGAMLSALMACTAIGCESPPGDLDVTPGDVLGRPPDLTPAAIEPAFGGPVTATASAAGLRTQTLRDANLHTQASAAVAGLILNLGATDRLGTDMAYTLGVQLMADTVRQTHGTQAVGLLQSVFAVLQARGFDRATPVTHFDLQGGLALALLQAHLQVKAFAPWNADATLYLQEALSRFATVRGAEAFDANGATQGIWADSTNTAMSAASNFTAVAVGVQLARVAGDPNHLALAGRVYDHWVKTGVDPNTFAIADSMSRAGDRADFNTQTTRNYGLAILAALSLHQATGRASYLADARGYADVLLTRFTTSVAGVPVLREGCGGTCTGDTILYRAIAYAGLVALAEVLPDDKALQAAVDGMAAILVRQAYNGATGTFSVDWSGPATTSFDRNAGLAAAVALARLAGTALASPQPARLPVRYEAEEAFTTSIGIEANFGAPTGFGYLAGWGTAGQAMSFPINVPVTGNYVLTLRYSATSDATRLLQIPSMNFSQTVAFSNTADYANYQTATLFARLTAGAHNVALTYSATDKSFLNLDALGVRLAPSSTSCALPAQPQPTSPVLDAGVCGSVAFTWAQTTGATSYQVVLDGRTACASSSGATPTCRSDGALSDGPHTWYVLASNGCGTTSSVVAQFTSAQAMPTLSGLTLSGSSARPVIAWTQPATDTGATVDVALNGAVQCARDAAGRCAMNNAPGAGPGQNNLTLTAANACGQSVVSASF
jgi:predicted alpha-1,6-mannanase (GH76 family)